ncbi:hypothetical protein [Ancylobacter sp.]|uniref:hypothetical protein n=1 Tax=Ancylobacter sp. TaxID=1872567 RepID=UPI003C7E382D
MNNTSDIAKNYAKNQTLCGAQQLQSTDQFSQLTEVLRTLTIEYDNRLTAMKVQAESLDFEIKRISEQYKRVRAAFGMVADGEGPERPL